MHPLRRTTRRNTQWTPISAAYRLSSAAFVLGLYLPWGLQTPDMARHVGEAVHLWVIIFFAPLVIAAACHRYVVGFVSLFKTTFQVMTRPR